MITKTYPYDAAEFLDTDEAIALFVEAVLEDGDRNLFRQALDDVARAHGFALLAAKAGIPRRRLFEALLYPDDDHGETVNAVLQAASVQPVRDAAE